LLLQDGFDKLPIAETVAAAKHQAAQIEGELQQTVRSFIATQPSLAKLNDPVTLQLLVYTILGLPVLLLLVLFMAAVGGPRKSQGGSAGSAQAKGKKQNSGGGSKKEAQKPAQGHARKAGRV
jgi:hypothetical protein